MGFLIAQAQKATQDYIALVSPQHTSAGIAEAATPALLK
jgi:hypothetical protein